MRPSTPLGPDETVVLLIHREPFPLYDILARNGYAHHAEAQVRRQLRDPHHPGKMKGGLNFEQTPPLQLPLRFFLSGSAFGILAGLLLAVSGDALASRWTPQMLALTHAFTAGFMLQVMCGALLQVLPVAIGGGVPRPILTGGLVHAAITLGAAALIGGFLSAEPTLYVLAGLLLAGGLVPMSMLGVIVAAARGGARDVRQGCSSRWPHCSPPSSSAPRWPGPAVAGPHCRRSRCTTCMPAGVGRLGAAAAGRYGLSGGTDVPAHARLPDLDARLVCAGALRRAACRHDSGRARLARQPARRSRHRGVRPCHAACPAPAKTCPHRLDLPLLARRDADRLGLLR